MYMWFSRGKYGIQSKLTKLKEVVVLQWINPSIK